MFYKIFTFSALLGVFLLLFSSCKKDENTDNTAPLFISCTPADGSSNVNTNTVISLNYNERIVLSSSAKILLNDVEVPATVNSQTLTIIATLQSGTSYTLIIPANAICDVSGNYSKEIKITFTTTGYTSESGIYEAEKASLSGDANIAATLQGYSGTGYVNTNSGNVTFTVQTGETGYYNVSFRYISGGQKINNLYIDGSQAAEITFPAAGSWTEIQGALLKITAGTHTISIVKNWGYIQLDFMRVVKDTVGLIDFNISPVLVTPNPSVQATNLYNFLKANFGSKIISGTMAAHSTNIAEATWVYNNTGKWPALTAFDFIDHTYPNQNWVNYSGPFTLGQNWWNNNGIVALMWHWRDPLTKSGSFYTYSSSQTDGTTFDITKINDTTSVEYKAMIADIDVIAGYLKQFKDAGIPVIWRPLHEAAGGWFWWGAKGAEPCKTLWRLMFDRMVNYHGLNNLIWVWTTNASSDALDWYPGDNYVDVLGMDIYPGENQHGSQYISYNTVRQLFGGKKLITLSECGSVPDPALMLEYGDTWSWFMPWNGDYTESNLHNGADWWKKFFSYDYVITRNKMPDLK